MSNYGFVDIEWGQIERMVEAIEKKKGTCKVLPAGRFMLQGGGPVYTGLVCSDKMGGHQTGVGAEGCKNCRIKGFTSE